MSKVPGWFVLTDGNEVFGDNRVFVMDDAQLRQLEENAEISSDGNVWWVLEEEHKIDYENVFAISGNRKYMSLKKVKDIIRLTKTGKHYRTELACVCGGVIDSKTGRCRNHMRVDSRTDEEKLLEAIFGKVYIKREEG